MPQCLSYDHVQSNQIFSGYCMVYHCRDGHSSIRGVDDHCPPWHSGDVVTRQRVMLDAVASSTRAGHIPVHKLHRLKHPNAPKDDVSKTCFHSFSKIPLWSFMQARLSCISKNVPFLSLNKDNNIGTLRRRRCQLPKYWSSFRLQQSLGRSVQAKHPKGVFWRRSKSFDFVEMAHLGRFGDPETCDFSSVYEVQISISISAFGVSLVGLWFLQLMWNWNRSFTVHILELSINHHCWLGFETSKVFQEETQDLTTYIKIPCLCLERKKCGFGMIWVTLGAWLHGSYFIGTACGGDVTSTTLADEFRWK